MELLEEFVAQKRRGIFVYLQHLKQSKQMRRFGAIQYVSRKMKYVLIYVNEEDVEKTVAQLSKLRYVKDIILSPRPELVTDFEKMIGTFKLTAEDQEKFVNKGEKKES